MSNNLRQIIKKPLIFSSFSIDYLVLSNAWGLGSNSMTPQLSEIRHVAHKVIYRGAFWKGNLSLFGPLLAILTNIY